MIIECKNCAAPLDVAVGATLARCQYCGKTQRVSDARTHMPVTPPGWNPPAQWTPPPHVPAPSVTLRYDATKRVGQVLVAVVVAAAVLPIVIAAVVIFVVANSSSSSSSSSSPRPTPSSRLRPAGDDRGRDDHAAPTPALGSGSAACAAAAHCCDVLGTQASGCEAISMVRDEQACRQLLVSLRQAAEAMGKDCGGPLE